jgi:hypothetical protein
MRTLPERYLHRRTAGLRTLDDGLARTGVPGRAAAALGVTAGRVAFERALSTVLMLRRFRSAGAHVGRALQVGLRGPRDAASGGPAAPAAGQAPTPGRDGGTWRATGTAVTRRSPDMPRHRAGSYGVGHPFLLSAPSNIASSMSLSSLPQCDVALFSGRYPGGVPEHDYAPLRGCLSEEEVEEIAEGPIGTSPGSPAARSAVQVQAHRAPPGAGRARGHLEGVGPQFHAPGRS